MDAVVLIGMPAVGKSTVGVLLAKRLSLSFLDTDLLIQTREKRSLARILSEDGIEGFCRIEEACVLSLHPEGHVLATGGSVVYSDRAMAHLRGAGTTIVHLDLSPVLLQKRMDDMDERGVVREAGQSVADLYAKRAPLYRRYQDVYIRCDGLSTEQVVSAIVSHLSDREKESQGNELDHRS
jgi:shikimate kinase